MAGRPRKQMSEMESRRRVHRSTDENDARRYAERPRGDDSTDPPARDPLTGSQADKYREIAGELESLGAWSSMLSDELVRYVRDADMCATLTTKVSEAVSAGDMESAHRLQLMQDKAFRHAHAAAASLGLTAPSRCSLVASAPLQDDDVSDV